MSFVEDKYQQRARKDLLEFFSRKENKIKIFYSRQQELLFEDRYYHWITKRTLRDLIELGELISEKYNLEFAGSVNLVWHKSFRYYKRAAKEIIELIDSYSLPSLSADIGLRGETLILEGFALNGFNLLGRETNEFHNLRWQESEHNLDFIFSKDNINYRVEVKNMLGYMDYEELEIKVRMCDYLGIKPIFAVRMFPQTWINEIREFGGFSLIMKYQFYPISFKDLAKKVNEVLGFPIGTPKRLEQGTMDRVLKWHLNNVNSILKSQ